MIFLLLSGAALTAYPVLLSLWYTQFADVVYALHVFLTSLCVGDSTIVDRAVRGLAYLTCLGVAALGFILSEAVTAVREVVATATLPYTTAAPFIFLGLVAVFEKAAKLMLSAANLYFLYKIYKEHDIGLVLVAGALELLGVLTETTPIGLALLGLAGAATIYSAVIIMREE